MTTPSATRISTTTTIPLGVVWTVGVVLAAVLLYGGRQLQRLDTIEQQVREVRDDVRDFRALLVRPTTAGR